MRVKAATARDLRARADEVEATWGGLYYHPRDGWNVERGASARQIAAHMRTLADNLEVFSRG